MQTQRSPPSVESRFCQRLKFRPSLQLVISTSKTPACLPSPSRTTVALDTTVSDAPVSFVEDSQATIDTCQRMLRLSLARETRPVFQTTYSPEQSECSSSSSNHRSRSPSPPRSPSPRRAPRSSTMTGGRSTLPRSQTHPTDLSSAGAAVFRRPSRSGNEEVLRSRLEGVLSSASTSRDISCPPSPHRRRATTSGEMPTYGLITPPHGSHPSVPAMTRSRTSPTMSRSSPITPPPSPPSFDASRIALQLRDQEGYVSFADVQGLGIPSEELDVVDAERGRGKWWTTLWKG